MPRQLPNFHQPNQTATHIRTKTLPHTEMENLTIYVILAAALVEMKDVGMGRFLAGAVLSVTARERCTFNIKSSFVDMAGLFPAQCLYFFPL